MICAVETKVATTATDALTYEIKFATTQYTVLPGRFLCQYPTISRDHSTSAVSPFHDKCLSIYASQNGEARPSSWVLHTIRSHSN